MRTAKYRMNLKVPGQSERPQFSCLVSSNDKKRAKSGYACRRPSGLDGFDILLRDQGWSQYGYAAAYPGLSIWDLSKTSCGSHSKYQERTVKNRRAIFFLSLLINGSCLLLYAYFFTEMKMASVWRELQGPCLPRRFGQWVPKESETLSLIPIYCAERLNAGNIQSHIDPL